MYETLRVPVVAGGTVHPAIGTPSDFFELANRSGADYYFGTDLAERVARDHLPIPHPENREGYHPQHHFSYWLSGLSDFLKTMEACARLGLEPERVYDLGGSTGRVFRHFLCQTDGLEVWSSDVKVESHLWNQQNMPGSVKAFLSSIFPPLPLPDGFFDLVTAYSVFTHIDEMEMPWLLELRRILRPGGLAYVTVQDEHFWSHPAEGVEERVRRAPNGFGVSLSGAMPAERLAFTRDEASHYATLTFHRSDYIRREWGRFFTVVDILPGEHSRQAVVLLTP